jgi:hypothetical protein
MSNRLAKLVILCLPMLLMGCAHQTALTPSSKSESLVVEPPSKEILDLCQELEAAGVTIVDKDHHPLALVAGLSSLEAAWVGPAWEAAGIPGGPMIYRLGGFAFYAPVEDYYRAMELVKRERERLARIQLTDFDSHPVAF